MWLGARKIAHSKFITIHVMYRLSTAIETKLILCVLSRYTNFNMCTWSPLHGLLY